MTTEQIPVNHQNLETFVADLFTKAGMPADDAAYCAECMVLTNLWGIDSHGVLRLPNLPATCAQQGHQSDPEHPYRARRFRPGSAGWRRRHGLRGRSKQAMARAIELAGQFSIGAVGVVRSNHFGAAALFARMASEQSMIGIAMTNVIPNIVAPGGAHPITGNNPIAIAVPTFGEFPFVLDISLSNVAGGKLLLASKKGEKIPFDWATDREGRPTDDPNEGFKGFLLPVGGHKGLGLSYVVDILSGVITGGVFQHEIKSMYKHADDPSVTGHFMIALNPLALMSEEDLAERMAHSGQRSTLRRCGMTREMLLPGELEHRKAQERRETGIPLPPHCSMNCILWRTG